MDHSPVFDGQFRCGAIHMRQSIGVLWLGWTRFMRFIRHYKYILRQHWALGIKVKVLLGSIDCFCDCFRTSAYHRARTQLSINISFKANWFRVDRREQIFRYSRRKINYFPSVRPCCDWNEAVLYKNGQGAFRDKYKRIEWMITLQQTDDHVISRRTQPNF